MKSNEKVYMSCSELARVIGCDRHTISRNAKALEEWNKENRRYKFVFVGDEKKKIHIGVYLDWITYKKALMDERTKDHVPMFNPFEALAYMGVLTGWGEE